MDTAPPSLETVLRKLPPEKRARLMAIKQAYPRIPFSKLPDALRREVQAIIKSVYTPPARGQKYNGHTNGTTARHQHTDTRTLASIIGTDIKTGRAVTISQKARQQGLYIIGATGTGKTTLLANLILQDIQGGFGICLIEPHGDLTRQVLGSLPAERLKDVIYLDMTDALHPFSVNLFECSDPTNMSDVAKVASFVMHLFERVWSLGTHTPLLAQVIRNVTRTCIETGLTFAEIPLLLWDDAVRDKAAKQVKNTQTQLFWQQYTRKSPRDRTEYTSSTINKVDAYLNEPMIAHIVSQEKSTISFRKIMDEGKILLVNMSPQLEEMSRLIGALLIGKLLMAAYSRVDIPEEQRRQFNLYVDEFEKFCTDDFSVLIAEARKFRVAIGALANQTLEQLDEANRAAALQAGSLIVFRVSGEDARVLARSFDTTPTQPYVIGEEAVRAPTNDTINFLLRKAHSNPAATACNRYLEYLLQFADTTVIPPPGHTPRGHYPNPRGSRAESVLEGLGDCFGVMLCNFLDRRKYRKAEAIVTDAQSSILLLNEYFSQVMLDRNPSLPIPNEVITLFGHKQFLNCETLTRNPALLAILGSAEFAKAHFPIAQLQKAGYWGRHDANYTQLCEFLTSLWTVVSTLAKDPILVETGQYRARLQQRTYSDMENEGANFLSQQVNFQAKVKILTQEHVIRSKPAPEVLTGELANQRITQIKRQMRTLGYTRPYREVEEEIRQRAARLLGITAEPPPPTTNGRTPATVSDPDEPPPGSFSLD